MKTLVPHIFAAALLLFLMFRYPAALIMPGTLIEGHREVRNDCLACHAPFKGPSTGKCISCHPPEQIGVATVAGNAIPKDAARPVFHQALAKRDCAGCHTDHAGLEAGNATRGFSHGLLPDSLRNACASCHGRQRPDDPLHPRVAENCASCHSTEDWQSVSFEHRHILAGFEKDCAACHQKDRPGDELHRQVKACYQCHENRAWKPATFAHERYFRFDRHHPGDCSACHTNAGNFSEYTCYNCHEHSPAKIAREHRKEGIFDFENCADCHRSGNKDEAKQTGRRKRETKRAGREQERDDD